MDALFARFGPLIAKHAKTPNVEIEMRLGRRAGAGFDTNVGKVSFTKAFNALSAYQGWEEKKHSKHAIYYFDGGKRLQIDEASDEEVGVVKKRLAVEDFVLEKRPLDVRLGISTETPFVFDGQTANEEKTKERWSFVRKNLSIDLTILKGDPNDKDAEDDCSYQIELEILDPGKTQEELVLKNLLNKVFDILDTLN